MYDDLESHYDVVITGTDLTSSLLAAAIARVGKSVLHLDQFGNYGQEWQAKKLFDLLIWPYVSDSTQSTTNDEEDKDSKPMEYDDSKYSFLSCNRPKLISNIDSNFTIFQNVTDCSEFIRKLGSFSNITDEIIQKFVDKYYPKLLSQSAYECLTEMKEKMPGFNFLDNNFTLDLCPRFLFANGPMVDILIKSNVTRYLEFNKVTRILTPVSINEDEADTNVTKFVIKNVPCTRNDVFKSKTVSLAEKRLLMTFLSSCLNYEQTEDFCSGYENLPISEFLESKKLTPMLRDLIINSVLMANRETPTLDALKQINKFLKSIGRFSDRPFIFPMYGSEDILQAFCRYAAIYGATYCLKMPVTGFLVDKTDNNKLCKSVLTKDIKIDCEFVVTDYQIGTGVGIKKSDKPKTISRAIICCTTSICSSDLVEGVNNSILHLPKELFPGRESGVFVFETDRAIRSRSYFVQYYWCDSLLETSRHDLEPIVETILKTMSKPVTENESVSSQQQQEQKEEPVPKIVWSVYFNQQCELDNMVQPDETTIPSNIFTVTPPINELDYDFAINEARTICEQMYPDEEFFPQTDDPSTSQIEVEDVDETTV